MNIKTSLFLAINSIKRGSKGTLVMTIMIMALAYINIVFISSVLGGIIDAIHTQAIDNQYGNILIEPAVDKNYIYNKKAINLIDSIPGIVGSSAHYIDNPIIRFDEYKDGHDVKSGRWILKSINISDEKKVTKIHESIIEGSFLDEMDRDKIIIGKEVAGGHGGSLDDLSLDVLVGDEIDVYYSNGIKKSYTVKGIFSTKSTQIDQMTFVTKKEMESVFDVYNLASEILVKIQNTGNEDAYIDKIRNLGLWDEDIRTWSDLIMGFTLSVSASFTMISAIFGAIGTIMAGITIFIIIFVSIVNKKRQIGILKAIGMQESTIILYFIIQALFYGIIGVALGVLIVLFVMRPYFISNPLDFPIGWVSLKITFNIIRTSTISLLLAALIGGFIPAYSGAKESILKLIWD